MPDGTCAPGSGYRPRLLPSDPECTGNRTEPPDCNHGFFGPDWIELSENCAVVIVKHCPFLIHSHTLAADNEHALSRVRQCLRTIDDNLFRFDLFRLFVGDGIWGELKLVTIVSVLRNLG